VATAMLGTCTRVTFHLCGHCSAWYLHKSDFPPVWPLQHLVPPQPSVPANWTVEDICSLHTLFSARHVYCPLSLVASGLLMVRRHIPSASSLCWCRLLPCSGTPSFSQVILGGGWHRTRHSRISSSSDKRYESERQDSCRSLVHFGPFVWIKLF
jgi:hypothetical protein